MNRSWNGWKPLRKTMENGELTLAELLAAYEEGAKLAKSLGERLSIARTRLSEVGHGKGWQPDRNPKRYRHAGRAAGRKRTNRDGSRNPVRRDTCLPRRMMAHGTCGLPRTPKRILSQGHMWAYGGGKETRDAE